MGRTFLAGGIIAAGGSLLVGAQVLYFTVTSEGAWDFQGASGMATVIPGLAGIILAGWAIYHQMRVSAPSYRAAEEALMEISDFRRSYGKIVSVITTSMPAPPQSEQKVPDDYDPADHNGPSVNIKNATPYVATAAGDMSRAKTLQARIEANNRLKMDRSARELLIDVNHSCGDSKGCSACDAEANSGRQSFARMAAKVLPLLDTLQHRDSFPSASRVNITLMEESIDFLGYSYGDFDVEYDLDDWCGSVIQVIHNLDVLIDVLYSKDLLKPSSVEKALLEPKQSRDIRESHAKRTDTRRILQSLAVQSDRASRFGSVGVTN